MGKVTLKNIKNFIQGYYKIYYDYLITLPKHEKEQILYRGSVCNDCLEVGKCKFCGCALPERFYSTPQCDGKKWPDLMGEKEWNIYKTDNKIDPSILE